MTRELKDLYDQKHTALDSMKALATKAKSGELLKDDQNRFASLEKEIESLNSRIAVVQNVEQRETELLAGKAMQQHSGNGEDTEFQDAVKSGDFFNQGGKEIPVFNRSSKQSVEDWTKRNYDNLNALKGISFGQIARAILTGPKNDIEQRALSEGTPSAGGYTVPAIVSAQIVDRLRPKSHVLSLGANMVMLESGGKELSMAKLTGGLSVEWLAENAASTAADPTFGQVKWAFKTLRALVVCSRELLEDSLNIEKAIEYEVVKGFAAELDRVSLIGTGTGAQPKGIDSFTNVNSQSMGVNGAAITNFENIIDAIKLLHDDNAEEPTGAIMAPRTYAAYSKLKDTANQPMKRPFTIETLSFRNTSKIGIADTQGTSSIASKIFLGDFTQLFWGVRTGIQIIPLNQRYAENNQIGFLAVMRADLQPYNEESFAKIIGVIP